MCTDQSTCVNTDFRTDKLMKVFPGNFAKVSVKIQQAFKVEYFVIGHQLLQSETMIKFRITNLIQKHKKHMISFA